MINEKEEIQRKIESTKERLLILDTEFNRLESLIAPLNLQIAKVQNDRKYYRGRIEKLTIRLSAF